MDVAVVKAAMCAGRRDARASLIFVFVFAGL